MRTCRISTFLALVATSSSPSAIIWLLSTMPHAANAQSSSSSSSIDEVVDTLPNHDLLTSFLKQSSDLSSYLTTPSTSATLFAPKDSHFADLTYPYAYYLHSDWYMHLHDLLIYHVVPQALNHTQIFRLTELETLDTNFTISVEQVNETVNGGASIETADIVASNGLVQIPSRVLLPDRLTCGDYFDDLGYSYSNIVTFLNQAGSLTQFLQVIDAENGMTLFVTPNIAFTGFSNDLMLYYFNSEVGANEIGGYQVADIIIYSHTHFAHPVAVTMYNGYTAWVYTSPSNNVTKINTATVTGSYLASNGVVNEIDAVIRPLMLVDFFNLTTSIGALALDRFVQTIETAGLSAYFYKNTTDSYTFFAPVDSAFDNAQMLISRLQQPQWSRHWHLLLLNHITQGSVKGDTLISETRTARSLPVPMLSNFSIQVDVSTDYEISVNGVKALASNLAALNGVIHGIADLLLPSFLINSIYQQISEFPTLRSLIQTADLVQALNNTEGPLTFLVPTEDALAKAAGQLSIFSEAEIRQIIMNHMFAANIYVDDLRHDSKKRSNSSSSNDSDLILQIWNVTTNANGTYVGGAMIVNGDNLAANGVYHVIDRVLIGSVIAAGDPKTSLKTTSSSSLKFSSPGGWGIVWMSMASVWLIQRCML